MPKPIFITGCGRSGTSVLTWAIGQHPNIIVTPEINWVSTLASHMEGLYRAGLAGGDKGHLATWNVSRAAFFCAMGGGVDAAIRTSFEGRFPDRRNAAADPSASALRWYGSPGDPKARWVDGTPSNVFYAGVLAEMFPEAKFINLLRNPDDVLRSWMGISWRDKRHSAARALLKHIHRSTEAGLMTHAAFGGDRAIRILFEDLISRPEQTVRAILQFLGEEYAPECVGPILAGKMNSSGVVSESVEREYQRVRKDWRLQQMQSWHEAARNPDWRVAPREVAVKEIAYCARYRLPLLGMIALPGPEDLALRARLLARNFFRGRM